MVGTGTFAEPVDLTPAPGVLAVTGPWSDVGNSADPAVTDHDWALSYWFKFVVTADQSVTLLASPGSILLVATANADPPAYSDLGLNASWNDTPLQFLFNPGLYYFATQPAGDHGASLGTGSGMLRLVLAPGVALDLEHSAGRSGLDLAPRTPRLMTPGPVSGRAGSPPGNEVSLLWIGPHTLQLQDAGGLSGSELPIASQQPLVLDPAAGSADSTVALLRAPGWVPDGTVPYRWWTDVGPYTGPWPFAPPGEIPLDAQALTFHVGVPDPDGHPDHAAITHYGTRFWFDLPGGHNGAASLGDGPRPAGAHLFITWDNLAFAEVAPPPSRTPLSLAPDGWVADAGGTVAPYFYKPAAGLAGPAHMPLTGILLLHPETAAGRSGGHLGRPYDRLVSMAMQPAAGTADGTLIGRLDDAMLGAFTDAAGVAGSRLAPLGTMLALLLQAADGQARVGLWVARGRFTTGPMTAAGVGASVWGYRPDLSDNPAIELVLTLSGQYLCYPDLSA